ncbi:MAG: hypothetical protein SA339_09460 [Methanomassiliicoccus sp.]|nr:hypothetical protein [Methanomassiliicoccus sp.]
MDRGESVAAVAIATIMFLAGSLGTVFILVSTNDIYRGEVNHIQTNGVNDLPLFTNLSIAVLGISEKTSEISGALNTSTATISYANDLARLEDVHSVKILLIDGSWLRDKNSKDVADALVRFFLNNTAIAVVGGPSDALSLVLHNTGTSGNFENSSSNSYAMRYAPGVKGAICFDLENRDTYRSTIVLYNWCVIQEARL